MTYTRSQVVESARSYLGVDFVHQGRSPVGLDCVGLCAVILKDLEYPMRDIEGYNRAPDSMELIKVLRKNFDRIEIDEVKAGDLYLMRIGDPRPRHVAVRVSDEIDYAKGIEPMIVHAYSSPTIERVVKQPVSIYKTAIVGGYRLRGLTD